MEIKLTCVLFTIREGILKFFISALILLCCTTVLGSSTRNMSSQDAEVSIDRDKTLTIFEVFELIGKQTECTFIYQSDIFNDIPEIHLKSGVIKVMTLLSQYLPARNFEINSNKDNLITISRKHSEDLQQKKNQVKGIIKDSNGMPIAGVSVQIKNTNQGTISDFDGSYSITANPTDILVFSALGFMTQTVPIESKLEINVNLQEDITQLGLVTINAGYYTVNDKERTGNISKVKPSDIEQQSIANPLSILQGRAAGVEIIQSSGVSGAGFDIKIRGQNSLRPDANAPLYVVDGVPYTSETIGSNFTSNIFPNTTSPLNSLNLSAIESIEILKDADATAIYGSRGANGVVLITTKKGKAGKTTFNLSALTGVGHVTKFMDLMNTEQYLNMRAQAFENDGFTEYPDWAYDINGTWDPNRYTDWQKELTGNSAVTNSFQGTASGGSENTQFLVGANYKSQTTVFPGDFIYKKGGATVSLNHSSTDNRFSLIYSGNYTAQNNNQPSFDPTIDSRRLPPNAPALYNEDGSLNWENGTWSNPLAIFNGEFKSLTNDLISNAVVSYKVFSNLELKSSFGYTDTRHHETRTAPSTLYNPDFGLGPEYSALFVSNTNRNSWIVEPQLSYIKDIGQGRLNVLVGSTFQKQTTNRQTEYGVGFTSNSLIYNLASASTTAVVVSDETIYKYHAIFGRLNYDWNNRYIVNLTGRRDGSSRFGTGNQFANFAAIGTAWIFSEEKFLIDSSIISFGKLRASYGSSGNDQIGDYQYLDTYSSSGGTYQGTVGLDPSRLFNPNFKWETNKKLEVGLEIGLWKDRILFTASSYRNKSSNQLVGIPLAGTTGFTSILSNLDAVVQNTGLEFTCRTQNYNGENFKWNSNINLTIARNKLVEFPGLESSTYKEQYRIGSPLNISLAYHYIGINSETGVYEFEDVNNDGQITFPDDRQTVIDLTPKFFGGFQNQFSFKNWNLDFLFYFVKQKKSSFTMGNAGTMVNQPTRLVDSWQNPGDNSQYQIYTVGFNEAAVTAQSLYESSDAAIVDGSYIRLRNVSLSYDLNIKSVNCKLFMQAQNLLTLTSYKDGDPESGFLGYLPPLRTISSGIQITF